jgi:hypothetical protein
MRTDLTATEVAEWLRRQASLLSEQASAIEQKFVSRDSPEMARVRQFFKNSGLSMHEFGVQMGYPEGHARKSVSQFLKGHDPRISVLRRCAKAMGVPIEDLVRPEVENMH